MLETEIHVDLNVNSTEAPSKRQKLNDFHRFTEENENIVCTICSEVWTAGGNHCLVSLKCGHLFGKSCITRWITVSIQKSGTKSASCPNCKKVASIKDIRIVLPVNIAAKDTTEKDELKRELEAKRYMIRDYQQSLELSHMSLNLLKKQLRRAQEDFDLLSSNSIYSNVDLAQSPIDDSLEITDDFIDSINTYEEEAKSRRSKFYIKSVSLLPDSENTVRVMGLSLQHNIVAISSRSSFTSKGILKLDLLDLERSSKYLPVHEGLIRDIQFSAGNEDHILTTSTDKTLKLSSIRTDSINCTFSLKTPGWSCGFDKVDLTKLYCGLENGVVMVYDIRNPSCVLNELFNSNFSKSPVHSLTTIINKDRASNLICANFLETHSWDFLNNETNYIPLDFDNQGYKPYSISSYANSSILLSSRNSDSTKHQILSSDQEIVTTIDARNHVQKNLSKTCSFVKYNENIVCYIEEEDNTLCLRGDSYSHDVKFDSCPLDVKVYDEHSITVVTNQKFYLLKSVE